MPDEQVTPQAEPDDVKGESFSIPTITGAGQAFLFIAHGFWYFWKNEKKKTIALLVLIGAALSQMVTNFGAIKALLGTFGVNVGP